MTYEKVSYKMLCEYTLEDALDAYENGFYCICGDGRIVHLTNDPKLVEGE